jgi:hypothetical protein
MAEEFKIAFGRHKGKPIQEVPAKYLLYIAADLKKELDEGKNLTNHKKKILEYCKVHERELIDSAFLNSQNH